MYDPHAHAEELGVTVEHARLQPGRWGHYDHERRTITLRTGLTAAQERAALAHEVVHAEHGDQLTGCPRTDARMERRADATAAARLVPTHTLIEALLLFPDDPAAVCAELRVPRWLLKIALRACAPRHTRIA